MSRTLASDRVWVCYAKSHLCILPSFASLIEYKNPVDSLILGVWGEFRRARAFRRSEAEAVNQGSPQNGFLLFQTNTTKILNHFLVKEKYLIIVILKI